MRLAERMIKKHNVQLSRREVMESSEDASVKGDMVKVHIRNPRTKKASFTKNWFHDLARAMTHHFNCKRENGATVLLCVLRNRVQRVRRSSCI